MSESPAQLWRALVSADPTRPFVTSYDASGGRVELSRATFDNWVSKTSNMLVDGLGVQPGDRVVVALPVHWQSLAWLVSCWSVGAVAEYAPDGADLPADAQVVVTVADRLQSALDSGADEVVGTSLHPLGLPLAEVPPTVLDYAVEVRGYGDHFSPYALDAGDPALRSGDGVRTGADLAAAARERAARWGLTGEDRLGLFLDPDAPLSALGAAAELLLAPVVAGAPLVVTPVDPAAPAAVLARAEMEKVTAVGTEVAPGLLDGTALRSVRTA